MTYNDCRITLDRWDQIQENAKAAARKAMADGKTDELTALGRAYYEKIYGGQGSCRVILIRSTALLLRSKRWQILLGLKHEQWKPRALTG